MELLVYCIHDGIYMKIAAHGKSFYTTRIYYDIYNR